ncbi:hypothetical protein MNBD_GAMMA13-1273 [hydrothermal vent metagenome]|uniref:Cytochrome d ubiquinol oxidase subunit III (Cytochrome bd-I oxidase subunit III) n=1 Tax=hydrothermal vent metagenome TaxID=652676 RepID=A0A3B0YR87_9ZZZZ
MVDGGFDLSWAWGIGLICFAFGLTVGVAGFYLLTGNQQCSKEKELASQLASAQQQFDDYREQVGQHFLKTSDLVQKMTSSYRDVYEHLANSSQTLCTDPVSTPQLDIPHQPMLNQESSDNPSEVDTNPIPIQKTSANTSLGDSPDTPDLNTETRH